MLSDKIKDLENENVVLRHELANSEIREKKHLMKIIDLEEIVKMALPVKVYTHKARRNTTVKFADGKCVTVKRKPGEKDCIETAIAYCIMKRVLHNSDIKKLVNEVEKH